MNTANLRYAVELAVYGSAQKAAESLNVSRTSITRGIKKLEEELGTQLFINTSEGAIPTIAGDACLRYARQILKIDNDLRFDLIYDCTQSGTVHIGIGLNRTQHILPLVLPAFHKKYPNINIQLYERNNAEMETALLNYQLDFALIISTDTSYIHFEPLYAEKFVLVAPEDDAFADSIAYTRGGKPYITLEKFKDKPFILGHPTQKSSKVCAKIFHRAGISPTITLQTKSSMNAALLAYEGMGYSIIPESYTTLGSYRNIPYYYLEQDLYAEWVVGIATRKEDSLSRVAAALKEEFVKVYENKTIFPDLPYHQ